ncbi:MAG TPA: hypothetical protein VFO10_05195 [Oligoflexus sp.]|uniref:hypothetical protein n=1 Tax=Oligoflexus sp. TaxID=1971216 RepID=UPI002D80CBC6|nr:hypothetical protein [Oligoflexus sp.]HET9236620.1 hypothetical protein [Oligoflexus sp.]
MIVLSTLFILQTPNVLADEMRPADDSFLKLNLLYSQQEQGIIATEILALSLVRFGRLGLSLANTHYYVRDLNDESQSMHLDQYALVWRNEDGLLSLNNALLYRNLGFVSSTREQPQVQHRRRQ